MSNDCPFCKLSSDVHTLDCVFIPNKTQQPVELTTQQAELLEWIKESAETIVYHYPNPELNHVDFRVRATKIAEEIVEAIKRGTVDVE